MHWCHVAGHQRLVRFITEGHNVRVLVVFPFQERLDHTFDIKRRVILQCLDTIYSVNQ